MILPLKGAPTRRDPGRFCTAPFPLFATHEGVALHMMNMAVLGTSRNMRVPDGRLWLTGQCHCMQCLRFQSVMLCTMWRTSNDIDTLGQQEWFSSDARGYNASARLHCTFEKMVGHDPSGGFQ